MIKNSNPSGIINGIYHINKVVVLIHIDKKLIDHLTFYNGL